MNATAKPPMISAVVTVFNKAPFLPATIRSLRRQAMDEGTVEYVFVDDASSDDSVSVINDHLADAPHARIIENADNRGPSIRLNQGAKAAIGEFLYFLDGDDIATHGAMTGMLDLLREEGADLIYGKTAKRLPKDTDLFAISADAKAAYSVSTSPLATVLGGGFVRMALMCRRDLYMRAGGADERIFVQDESLPIRLAAKAERLIDWQATVIAMPPPLDEAAKVSRNKSQLHHDAFLAYRNAIDDLGDDFPDLKPILYAKAVSAFWKYAKRKPGPSFLRSDFWRYLQTKAGKAAPRPDVLATMHAELAALPNVRRL
jgi:glycosyltransferase involved in cell wall biosynthesis